MQHFYDFHLISDNAGKNVASNFGFQGNSRKDKLPAGFNDCSSCIVNICRKRRVFCGRYVCWLKYI